MSKSVTNGRGLPSLLLLMVIATISLSEVVANAATLPVINWTQRSDWKNVKTVYGAVGDGSHDDTANIQAAFNGAITGGTIYFPAGNYKVTSTLTLTGSGSRDGINIIGNGSATTLSWYGPTTGDFITINSNPYALYEGFILDGRGIQGTGGPDTGYAIHHKNTVLFETEIRYKNVGIYNTQEGIDGDGSGTFASAEVSFENCIFSHVKNRGIMVYSNNEYDWTISGCDFIGGYTGVWCYHGNCYVRDCYFQGSVIQDLYIVGEHGCSVRRCKSSGSVQFINDPGSVSSLAVQDCYVTGWTGSGGAIAKGDNTPLSLSYCRFVSPPDSLAPVRLAVKAPVIDCDNAAPSSPAVYSYPTGTIIYSVPVGAYSPKVGGTNGANITTFINQEYYAPTTTYDAVTDYSAVGDGVHDDTTAIQNCINAAEAHTNTVYAKAIAYLPGADGGGTHKGKYKITGTLNVSSGSWVIFGGAGYGTHIIWGGTAGGTMVSVTVANNITLENMKVGHSDDGAQNNGIDIDQSYPTGTIAMVNYDGIYVYGRYQNNAGVKGLRINGGSSGLWGVGLRENWVEGNLRYLNTENGVLLANITYEGAITVDHTVSGRLGHLYSQTRLSTNNTYGVTVNNSNSITMSDWYQEQNSNGVSLNGASGDPAGRVTIQGPKTGLPVGSTFINSNNYNGKVFYGTNQMYPAGATTETITATGTNPLEIVLYGNAFYNTSLTSTGITPNTVGNWSIVGSGTPPADNYTSSTLSDMSSSFDDLQSMGVFDLGDNYPFLPSL